MASLYLEKEENESVAGASSVLINTVTPSERSY